MKTFTKEDIALLATIANARSGGADDERKFMHAGLICTAADSWTSLTPAGRAMLTSHDYHFDGQNGWAHKDPFAGELLPLGTTIISLRGEINEIDDAGEVWTGPRAQGFVSDVIESQVSCYRVTFQNSSIVVYLTKAELSDPEQYQVGPSLRDGEVIGFDDLRLGNLQLVQWNAEKCEPYISGDTLDDWKGDMLSATECKRLLAPANARVNMQPQLVEINKLDHDAAAIALNPTQLVEIRLSALTRVEYVEVARVPSTLTDSELNDLVLKRYDQVDGGNFFDDPEYWERGTCYATPAAADAVAQIEVHMGSSGMVISAIPTMAVSDTSTPVPATAPSTADACKTR